MFEVTAFLWVLLGPLGPPPAVGEALKVEGTPWLAKPLSGPTPDWKAQCATCTVEKKYPAEGLFLEVLLLGDRSYQEFPTPPELVFYKLAFRTKAGWFVLAELATDGPRCGGDAPFFTSFHGDKPAYIPRTAPESALFTLLFEEGVMSSGRGRDHGAYSQTDDVSVIACGVLADQRVACTYPTTIRRRSSRTNNSWDYTHDWREDGALVLSIPTHTQILSFAVGSVP